MIHWTLSVFTLCLFVFSLGCDRLSVDSTTISLAVPKDISNKVMSSSTPLELVHLVVQVTGSDLEQPIMEMRSHRYFRSIEPEVSLEVPNGPNRLIQVIAAYQPVGQDGGATIYYGDVTRNISASEIIDVPLTKMESESDTHGDIRGRYFDTANSGPSGTIKAFYQPTGKPAILLDENIMVGGWFESLIFSSIPLTYVLSNGDVLGSEWTTENIPVTPARVVIYEPSSYRQRWDTSNSYTWEHRKPEANVFGFFSKNQSLVSDKKICIDTVFGADGTMHSAEHLLHKFYGSAAPIKHFIARPHDPNALSFLGGAPLTDCDGRLDSDEYISYVKVQYLYKWENSAWDFVDHSFYMDFPLQPFSFATPYSLDENQTYRYSHHSGVDAGGPFLAIKLLPGTSAHFTQFRVYEKNSVHIPEGYYEEHYSEVCRQNQSNYDGWNAIHQGVLPSSQGGLTKFYKNDLKMRNNEEYFNILCIGSTKNEFSYAASFSYHQFQTPEPTSLRLTSRTSYNDPQLPVDMCIPYEVGIQSQGLGSLINADPQLKYSLSAKDSADTPASIIYTEPDCSGIPVSELSNRSFPAYKAADPVYVKINFPSVYTLSVESSPLLGDSRSLEFVPQSTNFGRMELAFDPGLGVQPMSSARQLPPQGCFPLVATAYSTLDHILQSSGPGTLSWKDLDGSTTYSLPSGVKTVNNCTNRSPISALSFTNGLARFAIVTESAPLTNAHLEIDAFSTQSQFLMNRAAFAHRLQITLPSGSSPTVGACHQVQLTVYDENGVEAPIPTGKILKYWIHSMTLNNSTPNVSFYSDPSCSTHDNDQHIPSGVSSSDFYFKASTNETFDLSISSEFTDKYESGKVRVTPVGP